MKHRMAAMAALSAALVGVGALPAHAQDTSAQNPAIASSATASAPLAKGENSFTKGEARSRLEKAGYSHVTGLQKDANGLWQAHAMLNGASVNVALDYKGAIATQ